MYLKIIFTTPYFMQKVTHVKPNEKEAAPHLYQNAASQIVNNAISISVLL
jgi:hypothetical protein